MATKPRIDYEGCIHHVMNRGGSGREIFLDDHDRRVFLTLLEETMERYGIEIVAYCLMGNHYHVVLKSNAAALSKAMQRLGSMYVRRFNRRHGFDGALFRGRFTSVVVESTEQLATTVRYVHRNPLGLGMDIRHHPWSSYPAYLGLQRPAWGLQTRWQRQIWTCVASMAEATETDLPTDQTAIGRGIRTISVAQQSPEEQLVWFIVDGVSEAAGSGVESILTTMPTAANDARLCAVLLCYEHLSATSVASFFGFRSEASVRRTVQRARRRYFATIYFADLVNSARGLLEAIESAPALNDELAS